MSCLCGREHKSVVRLSVGTCRLLYGAAATVAAAADLQRPEGAQGGDQDDQGEGLGSPVSCISLYLEKH